MMTKKPYTAPQIFQVELNQQQAILTACTTTTTSLVTRAGGTGCSDSNTCRRYKSGSSANAPS